MAKAFALGTAQKAISRLSSQTAKESTQDVGKANNFATFNN